MTFLKTIVFKVLYFPKNETCCEKINQNYSVAFTKYITADYIDSHTLAMMRWVSRIKKMERQTEKKFYSETFLL